MEASSEANLYAPPQAQVSDITPVSDGQVLATRKRRLAAGMIDGALGFLAIWLLSKATSWDPFQAQAASQFNVQLLPALAGFAGFLVIHSYLLWTRGQTVGKALLGMRIVRTDGSAVSFARLVGLRYGVGSVMVAIPVLMQIYSLLDCLLIFRASRQCLHDQIADTVVIKL